MCICQALPPALPIPATNSEAAAWQSLDDIGVNKDMNMAGREHIAASRERVYEALNDPEILKAAIPGCETIDVVSPTEMTATVVTRIGPVKAKFQGAVTLSDLDPPSSYTISGEGKGGTAGFAKGGATVRLEEDGAGTLLHYEVKADVGGKLAQLGSRLIDSTARKLAGDFFTRFGELVAGPAAQAAPVAEPQTVPARPASVPEAAGQGASAAPAISPWIWGLAAAVAALAAYILVTG